MTAWRVRDLIPQIRLIPEVDPQAIFRSLPGLEIPWGHAFIIHENMYTTHVALSSEELGTKSKNNLRRITSGIMPISGINSLTPLFILSYIHTLHYYIKYWGTKYGSTCTTLWSPEYFTSDNNQIQEAWKRKPISEIKFWSRCHFWA